MDGTEFAPVTRLDQWIGLTCCDVNDYYIKPVNKYTTTIQRLKSTNLLLQQCLLFLDKQLRKIVNSCSRACYITPLQ